VFEAIAIGILLGVITGLTPGIHNNTVAVFILSYLNVLSKFFSGEELAIIVFTNAIVHTFLDIIPTVFLGVPDEDMALGILPTHQLVLDGRGIEACFTSAFSSFTSFLIALPIFVLILNMGDVNLRPIVPLVLLTVSVIVIMSERGEVFAGSLSVWKKRFYAFLVFTISGLIGYHTFGSKDLLLPLLSGLFASPVLLTSIFTGSRIPKQVVTFKNPNLIDVACGTLAGTLVSFFPGISSGVATVIASNHLKSNERIVSAISSANTSNAILCFAILFAFNKTRSGAVSVFKEIVGTDFDVLKLILIGFLTSLIALQITLLLSLLIGNTVTNVKQSYLSACVFVFLIALIYLLTGSYGLMIFSISTFVGLLTVFLNVRKINCMGCLIIPTIWIYLS